jgi:hypothetical protein
MQPTANTIPGVLSLALPWDYFPLARNPARIAGKRYIQHAISGD